MKSAKSVALIKKNSEVPSHAFTFSAELINSTSLLKYLASCKIAFSLYIMVLAFTDLFPYPSSTKPD